MACDLPLRKVVEIAQLAINIAGKRNSDESFSQAGQRLVDVYARRPAASFGERVDERFGVALLKPIVKSGSLGSSGNVLQ